MTYENVDPNDIARIYSLIPELELIGDRQIADGVARIWVQMWRSSNYETPDDAPVSPHLRDRSLITQSRCVAMIALDAATRMKEYHSIEFNRDHLLAACLLLDASKLVEYFPNEDDVLARTEVRRQLPHAFLSAEAARREGLPPEVVHIILYHTPRIRLNPTSTAAILAQNADIAAVDCLYFEAGRLTGRTGRDPEAGNIA